MIELHRGQRELELAARTDRFIRETVIPYEKDPRIGHHGPSDELRVELQAHARSAGLLAPQLSRRPRRLRPLAPRDRDRVPRLRLLDARARSR